MDTFKAFLATMACLTFLISQMVYAETWYTVDNATEGNQFTINDSNYTSSDYCFGVRAGDKVTFTEGGPGSYCETATFKVQRNGQVCHVKCH